MNVFRRRKLYVDNVAFIVNTPALSVLQTIVDELPETDNTGIKIARQLTIVRDMLSTFNDVKNKGEAARLAFQQLKIIEARVRGREWRVKTIPDLIMNQSKAMVRTKFKLSE